MIVWCVLLLSLFSLSLSLSLSLSFCVCVLSVLLQDAEAKVQVAAGGGQSTHGSWWCWVRVRDDSADTPVPLTPISHTLACPQQAVPFVHSHNDVLFACLWLLAVCASGGDAWHEMCVCVCPHAVGGVGEGMLRVFLAA